MDPTAPGGPITADLYAAYFTEKQRTTVLAPSGESLFLSGDSEPDIIVS